MSFMRYLVATMAETMEQARTRCPRSGMPSSRYYWLSPSLSAAETENPFLSISCSVTSVGLVSLEQPRASSLPHPLHHTLPFSWVRFCLPTTSSIRGHVWPYLLWTFSTHKNTTTKRRVIHLRGHEVKSFSIIHLSIPGHWVRSKSSALASPLCFSACLTCP